MSDYDGKKFLWEVVDDYVVEEGKENYDIGLRGFYVNFLDGHKGGGGGISKGLSEYFYLIILLNI